MYVRTEIEEYLKYTFSTNKHFIQIACYKFRKRVLLYTARTNVVSYQKKKKMATDQIYETNRMDYEDRFPPSFGSEIQQSMTQKYAHYSLVKSREGTHGEGVKEVLRRGDRHGEIHTSQHFSLNLEAVGSNRRS